MLYFLYSNFGKKNDFSYKESLKKFIKYIRLKKQCKVMANDYNISVVELDENSPRIDQPSNITISLKPHQLSLIHRCRVFETDKINITDSDGREAMIKSDICIIADVMGSGKSNCIMALSMIPFVKNADVQYMTFGHNKVCITKTSQQIDYIKTNLLVIPTGIVAQWKGYAATFSNDLKWYAISRRDHLTKLNEDNNLETYDLIIVSNTFYNNLAHDVNERNLRFSRVFYDEVDNINIPSAQQVQSCFTYFVSASYGNLLYPRGHDKWDINSRRYIKLAAGLLHSGYIKNIFSDLCGDEHSRKYARHLVIRNNDEFVKASYGLPEMISKYILCKTPTAINILSGIADRNVIDCLNAGDIDGALDYISPSHRSNEDNIVSQIVNKFEKQVKNLDIQIQYTTLMEYASIEDKNAAIARLNERKNDLNKNIENIKIRIKESNSCTICLDDVATKTVLECCSNAFCFKCINIWLTRSRACPLCKTAINRDNLYVVSEASTSRSAIANRANEDHSSEIHPTNDKMKNLENIFRGFDGSRKVLIFSSFEYSFGNIASLLYSLNIRYAYLKGASGHIRNIVDSFNSGETQVLFANASQYGSGLNLPDCTDIVMFHKFDSEIEKQIIGRAQRPGRQNELNVWYLLHENEMSVGMVATNV